MTLASIFFLVTAILVSGILLLAHRKGIVTWLPHYLLWVFRRASVSEHKHIMFCFVDHFEPRWGSKRNMEMERRRVARWVDGYPRMAAEFTDSDGVHPKHSFFFPAEEYEAEHLDALAGICKLGLGEIEVHLHHDNDTSENLRKTLLEFARTLHEKHGALSIDPRTGELSYAFIHGNWVLDNSHPDGRWCGVNDEITVLRDTGCYADFTFPCAPHPAQPRQVNSIYYAIDDPERPKSHDTGARVSRLKKRSGDLMLITGPVRFNWKRRKLGFMPKIENSDVRSSNPPTKDRIDYWVDTGISVAGKPDWVFVKVHTHGAPDTEAEAVLGDPIKAMHQHLTTCYNDGRKFSLHYTSAREMYNIIKAAEAGKSGNPNDYRDFVLPRPSNTIA